MSKVIAVDYEKCVGCRTCEMVCSLKHEMELNPFRSRIKIVKWEGEGRAIPMNCRQCESAPCEAVCPVKAISRDELLGREVVNYDVCIGCRMCVAVCPFGAMSFDISARRVIKCDLCDGEALCAKFCVGGALQYVDVRDWSTTKQVEAAEKLSGVMRKVTTTIATLKAMPYA